MVHEQRGDLPVGPQKCLGNGDSVQQIQSALDRVGHVVAAAVVPIELLVARLEQICHGPAHGLAVAAGFQRQAVVEESDKVVPPSVPERDAVVGTRLSLKGPDDDAIRIRAAPEDFVEHILEMRTVLLAFFRVGGAVDGKQQSQPADNFATVVREAIGNEAAGQEIVVGQTVRPIEVFVLTGHAIQPRQDLEEIAVDLDVR